MFGMEATNFSNICSAIASADLCLGAGWPPLGVPAQHLDDLDGSHAVLSPMLQFSK